jgi:hypothetical protein
MTYVAVTRNLGGWGAASQWIKILGADARGDVDLLALQELPHRGASITGYQTIPESASLYEPSNARRSALLLKDGLKWRPATSNRFLALLGDYIALAEVQLGEGWITVVSVHAAPYAWKGSLPADDQLVPRRCEKHLWHSDIAAAGLIQLAKLGPVLALGDYNECLGWDEPRHPGHHCGRDYFAALDVGDLVDCTTETWGGERQTGPQPGYQVDRVIADKETARRIHVFTDPLEFDGFSDHAPIWLTVTACAD